MALLLQPLLQDWRLQPKLATSALKNLRSKPAVVLRMLEAMQHASLEMSIPYCNIAIDSCGRGSQWTVALSLLRDIEILELSPTAVSYTSAISACGAVSKWAHALRVFQTAVLLRPSPDAMLFGAAMNVFAAHGQWEWAACILAKTAECQVEPSVIGCNILMNALEKSGKWQKVLETYFKLPSEGVQANAVSSNTAITAAAQHSQWQVIVELVALMPKMQIMPDADTFSLSLKAMAKTGQWQACIDLLARMFMLNLKLHTVHSNSAVKACSRSAQWQYALMLLSDSKARNIDDSQLYTTAITSCAGSRAWQASLALLAELDAHFVLDVVSYGAALSAFAEAPEQWAQALRLLADLRRRRLTGNLLTHTPVVSACGRAQQWRSALALLEELQDEQVEVDVALQTSVANACSRGSQWDRALHLFAQMQSSQMQVDAPALHTALDACGKGGQWHQALQLFAEFWPVRSKDSYTVAISALSPTHHWQQALWLLNLQHNDPERHPPSCICTACTAAISVCGGARQWQRALTLFDLVLKAAVADTTAFNAALDAIGRTKWQHALRMLNAQPALSDTLADATSYSTVLSACVEASAWQAGVELLEQCLARNMEGTVSLYNVAITAWTRGSAWQTALLMMVQLQDHSFQCDQITYGAAIHACGFSQHWRHTLEVLGAARACDLPPNDFAFGAVLFACHRSQRWSRAISLLHTMSHLNFPPSLASYDYAILAAQSNGQVEHAFEMLVESEHLRSPESFLWALATLRTSDPDSIHTACTDVVVALEASQPDAKSLSLAWWSAGMLGVRSLAFNRLMLLKAVGQLPTFSLEELSMISAGASIAGAPDFLDAALDEIVRRVGHASGDVPENFSFAAGAKQLLGILFSCRTAGCLRKRHYFVLHQAMRRVGKLLDSSSEQLVPEPAAQSTPNAQSHQEQPYVCTTLADTAVVHKPQGWEVYGQHVKLQLSTFVRGMFGSAPIFTDPDHNYGFLHRLDVPSSGLILVAKTYEAFYDLQVQLHAGGVRRDYTVLCHGWLPKSVTDISASTWCDDDRPTLCGGRGKPSYTHVQNCKYLRHKVGALSRVVLGIATGRKHQIRSHMAYIGHPAFRDHFYTGITTFNFDVLVCARNWLHRHRLQFLDTHGHIAEIFSDLPQDLQASLDSATMVRCV